MTTILTLMRAGEAGLELKTWEVPDDLELEPGPDWIAQDVQPPLFAPSPGAGLPAGLWNR